MEETTITDENEHLDEKPDAAEVNPLDLLTINVRGIALMYEKDDHLNIRCPHFDEEHKSNQHKLKLKITSGMKAGDPVYMPITIPDNSNITIESSNFQAPERSNFDHILNIAELHRPNAVKFAADVNNVSSLIKINGAKMQAGFSDGDVIKVDKFNFKKWEITNHEVEGEEVRHRKCNELNICPTATGKVRFTDLQTASTKITIETKNFNLQLNLQHSKDGRRIPHTIEISNLCDEDMKIEDFMECDSKSDFLLYYPMVQNDKLGKKYDFELTEIKGNRAPCNVAFTDSDPE